MLETLITAESWAALLKIIGINIVLSGDNAVVIALACRSLAEKQRKMGVLFGSAGAIVLRIILTFFAVYLMNMPYLKIVGALLLLWIGIKLILPEDGHGEGISENDNLMAAVRTIIIADFVMSLDNVIGVAAAANGSIPLIVIGLLISIPIIIFGSTLIMKVMDRFPVIITIGGGLLGYVAGEMAVTDNAVTGWIEHNAAYLHIWLPVLGAVFVVAVGKWLASRQERKSAPLVDLAAGDTSVSGK
ncbi:MAG: TerC family protein [Burkholderiales bacterium]